MKTRLGALLLAALAVLTIADGGCNGSNEVSGPGGGARAPGGDPTPVVTRHPRPTPGACTSPNASDCGD
jgi:hypothetical protein